MTIKPTRNQVLIRYLREKSASDGGIVLLCRQGEYSRAEVVAAGPEVLDEIQPGVIVHVHGGMSGVKIEDNLHIVDDSICVMYEVNDEC